MVASVIQLTVGTAFGIVYKCEWRMTTVAVKQLKSDCVEESLLSSFRAEMKLLRDLTPHQNIIQMLGVCTSSVEELCIVTPYCPNGSLFKFLRTSNKITKSRALKLLKGIAAGRSVVTQ